VSRILFVAIYYWPELSGNAPYTSLLAEHLAERGHDVTVLTGMPHYPEGRIQRAYRGRLGWSEEHRGVEVRRRAHYVPGRQTALRRAAYEASFLLTGSFFRARPRPDIIVGVSPCLSGAALAAEYAFRTRRPFGLILQDLMGRAAEQSGISGGRTVARATAAAEGWIARRASSVAVVAPDFVAYLLDRGVRSDRIVHLPNWTHIAEPRGDRAATRRRLGWADHETIVLHAGNMGLKQGLEQVVDAAKSAGPRAAGVRFVLMGDGNQRSELERRAAGLSNVDFRPFEPPETFPDTLAAADILLLSERPSVRDMSLPSKVTSYLAAGRPIIAAVAAEGATAGLVTRSGAAILANAGDPPGILRAIASIRADPVAGERLGRAGQRFATTELSSLDGLARSAEFVEQISAERPSANAGT
jgi:putative colanic acid biosynthesis glycosyltransferase WcaI